MEASSTPAEVGVVVVNTVAEVNTVVEASIVAEVTTKEQVSIAEEVNIVEEVIEAAIVEDAVGSKRKMKRHSELSLPRISNSTTKPPAIKDLLVLLMLVAAKMATKVAVKAAAEATITSSLKMVDKVTRTT
jgi:hypothetical protein